MSGYVKADDLVTEVLASITLTNLYNLHSALFDTSIKSNPSKSVVGVGLKSWLKFGVAVTGKSNINKVSHPPVLTSQCLLTQGPRLILKK